MKKVTRCRGNVSDGILLCCVELRGMTLFFYMLTRWRQTRLSGRKRRDVAIIDLDLFFTRGCLFLFLNLEPLPSLNFSFYNLLFFLLCFFVWHKTPCGKLCPFQTGKHHGEGKSVACFSVWQTWGGRGSCFLAVVTRGAWFSHTFFNRDGSVF